MSEKEKGAIPSEAMENGVSHSLIHPAVADAELSEEKEVLRACPQCGEVPEIGYCCGEYFIFHPSKIVGMCFCSSFAEMHSSEDTEIEAWNREVNNYER